MNDQKYFKRILGRLYPEKLRQKRATIVGSGSGGGRGGVELGRLGIQLCLIDRPGEVLEEHNIHRHELGYRSLGQPKTTELAQHIHNYNPSAKIDAHECDVVCDTERFERLVTAPRSDVILVATDNELSRHSINAVAFRHGFPVIGAAVYDGGIAGEVYRTGPGMPCYACISEFVQGKAAPTRKKLSVDYNSYDLNETRSTSALNLDIAQIALIQTRIALNVLLGEQDIPIGIPAETNCIVFTNRSYKDVFPRPLHADFYAIPARPNCLVCGQSDESVEHEAQAILESLHGN